MFRPNNKVTKISSVGEFGLIKSIAKEVALKNKSSLTGIGDDAAVLNFDKKHTLVSTDLLIEDIHFDIVYTPLKHLGYKAAVVNFSDIAAMNGVPKQLTISIAVSSRYTVEAIDELYSGILLACEKYGVDLVGGDTTSSKSGLLISGTVIGEAEAAEVTYRKGANENDLICVTGDLGGAYMGLHVLRREKSAFMGNPEMQPDLDAYSYVLERQLKPEPRNDMYAVLKDLNVQPTAMIDVSDGLASDLMHICSDSETGCALYEDKIPIDQQTYDTAIEFELDPTTCALNGGEDYELLFTIKQDDFEKVKNSPHISVIGYMSTKESGYNIISKDGRQYEITAQGWDALLKKDK